MFPWTLKGYFSIYYSCPKNLSTPINSFQKPGADFSQSHALGWTSVCLYWRLSSEIIFLTSLLLLFLCLFVYKYLFPPLDGKPYGYDVVFQSLSCVWLFVILWTAVHQASLSFTISQSLLKFMSIQLVMLSNHLILCCPFFSCPQFFPASGFFPMSWLLASGGQSIGASAYDYRSMFVLRGWSKAWHIVNVK